MKRLGNIWQNVTDINNGITAIIDGTRFKRKQRAVQPLLYSQEEVATDKTLWHRIDEHKAREYARRLCCELKEKTWEHQKPRYRKQYCANRTSNHGKWRDLYIPSLDDHIIAHMVMNASMEAFMRGMHPHSCGSVPGRGVMHVNKTVKRWMESDKCCRYFVKLDIRHFFESINKEKLMEVLKGKIKDKDVLWVFEQIINSAPIPCPVGYYTSPWLANLYLEKLDWFIEHQLYKERRGKRIKYVRHYLRYVDDLLLIGTSKDDLEKAIDSIKQFLLRERNLKIKDSWEIKPIGKHEIINGEWRMKPGTYWCDIGGYKFSKDATIMRDGIYLAAKRLAKRMGKKKILNVKQCQALNSRIGWASHCDSKGFVRKNIMPFVDIKTTRGVIGKCGLNQKTVKA